LILSIATVVLAIASANAAVPSLNPGNYESLTEGKTVFIKFFAPWCGHCKKMAPDWEELSAAWEGNAEGLIAEVDCTIEESKPLCEANGVQGFPTLKYGEPSDLQDYQGGRTLDDFTKFASENLKPMCSPAKLELCDDEKKAEIEKLMTMDDDALQVAIAAEEKKSADAEDEFKQAVEGLQATYQKLMDDKDATIAAVKASGLGLMKSVSSFKAKQSAGSDEL